VSFPFCAQVIIFLSGKRFSPELREEIRAHFDTVHTHIMDQELIFQVFVLDLRRPRNALLFFFLHARVDLIQRASTN